MASLGGVGGSSTDILHNESEVELANTWNLDRIDVADENKGREHATSLESVSLDDKPKESENEIASNQDPMKNTSEVMKSLKDSGYEFEQAQAVYTFRYLLVFNACLESFAHGSNDTANATGAFSAVYQTYLDGFSRCDKTDSPVWVMMAAGFFVFLGFYSFGRRVIMTMGKGLVAIDYHRGFWIEFGSTLSVIIATLLAFPISTTHCQVGAVCFVGWYEFGRDKVAWSLLGKIALTWIITLPLAGGIGAFMTWCFDANM